MPEFVIVPLQMAAHIFQVLPQTPRFDTIRAVLAAKPVSIPCEYEFGTQDGDRCRVIAWSEEQARRDVADDLRFPGALTLMSTCPAWPGRGVTRVINQDYHE